MDTARADKIATTTCFSCGNTVDITDLEPGDGIACPYCNHEFFITRQCGGFLLERFLGSGGMGSVYLARDVALNRIVAVKVLKPNLVSNEKFIATFLREAEITASLNHPNIVQVYAFGQHDGDYYMVVENIPGGSLEDKIRTQGRITELEGIEIGLAVARGLQCALEKGLIHRDIKPGNILLTADNRAKVVDFGLSMAFDTTDHLDGEIWGTPFYISPEKLERVPEDFRSDLYSLGATLFHAISGRPPFNGSNPGEIALKHLTGNVVSLKAFVPDISDQTAYAISKALARQPDDRYESYADFIAQLEDAKRRLTDPNYRKEQPRETAIIQSKEVARYNLLLVWGMVGALVIIAGLCLWKGSALFENKAAGHPAEPEDVSDATPPASTSSAPASQVRSPEKSAPAALAPAPNDQRVALKVRGGTGSGRYLTGATVAINAHPPSRDYQFTVWKGDIGSLADPSAKTTTVSMPSTPITVWAVFNPVGTIYPLTVENGTGGGIFVSGTKVTVTANAPPAGSQFSGWTGATSGMLNPSAATTPLTTAPAEASITATYAPNTLGSTTVVSVQFPQFYQNKTVGLMNARDYTGGVIPVQGWNVASANTGTSSSSPAHLLNGSGNALGSNVLINSAGANTTIGFSYEGYSRNDRAENAAFPDQPLLKDGAVADKIIAAGSSYNENGDPLTLSLSGLDPAHTYDLILYVTSAWYLNDGSAPAAISCGGTTYYVKTAKTLGTWTQATSTTEDSPTTGNYVKFSHLTGSATQTVTLKGAGVGLASFQIVDPEGSASAASAKP